MPPPHIPLPDPAGPCTQAGPDRMKPGSFLRSMRRCQQGTFTVTVRRDQYNPGGNNDLFIEGFAEIRSEKPIRAFNFPHQEPCRIHHGFMNIGSDGYAHPWIASQPMTWPNDTDGGNSFRRNSPLFVFFKGDDTPGESPPGFAYFGGAWPSHVFTEAILHSQRRYCGPIG